MADEKSINHLAELVGALSDEDRRLFERIFLVSTSVGRLSPTPQMHEWIEKYFGSVEAVRTQKVVRVTNLVTMEGSLFNRLRARRPMARESRQDLAKTIEEARGGAFCQPEQNTPEDTFGRIKGEHSLTASNIAKFDGHAGVVIFDEHNPLKFTEETLADHLDTGMAWLRKAHETDQEARYPFLLWNCLWRAGASIVHGHAQVVLGKDIHYAKVEGLHRAALTYRHDTGGSYFDDLYDVHQWLGLGVQQETTRIMVYLSPVKDKEVLLLSEDVGPDLKRSLYRVLDCYVNDLDVTSFNVALLLPPMGKTSEDWSGFPVVARVVDRGDPFNRTVDMAAMELYASSVLFSDPFEVAATLWKRLEH
jgi:Asp-tRNA(Asn)/Glu-tRNA(Gln) amidotransferase C subunit